MSCFKRSMYYIIRKKAKTLILFFVFLVLTTMILGTRMIIGATAHETAGIKKKTGGRIVAEVKSAENLFDKKQIAFVRALDNVGSLNRSASLTARPCNFTPVSGNEKESKQGLQVNLLGYDDIKKDSPFASGTCRIVKGRNIVHNGEIVIDRDLAGINRLQIGDRIEFTSPAGMRVGGNVVGFYLNGGEEKQSGVITAVNRIENQIYLANDLLIKLAGKEAYGKFIVYVKDPDRISETKGLIEDKFRSMAEISRIDTTYRQMKISLDQTERIIFMIFAISVFTGIGIVSLLLAMWLRNRKTELAIYRSCGISKVNIFLQLLLEAALVFSAALIFGGILDARLLPRLARRFDITQTAGLDFRLLPADVGRMWGAGIAFLTILIIALLIPLFGKQLKNILSETEE